MSEQKAKASRKTNTREDIIESTVKEISNILDSYGSFLLPDGQLLAIKDTMNNMEIELASGCSED